MMSLNLLVSITTVEVESQKKEKVNRDIVIIYSGAAIIVYCVGPQQIKKMALQSLNSMQHLTSFPSLFNLHCMN